MPNFRRSRYLIVTVEDLPDSADSSPAPESDDSASCLVLTMLLSGQHLLTAGREIELLRRISCKEWTPLESLAEKGIRPDRLELLARLGALLSDQPEEVFRRFIDRENCLADSHWPPGAAIFHLLNHHYESSNRPPGQVIDIELQEQRAEERSLQFLKTHGQPPPAFFKHEGATAIENLPLEVETSAALTAALLARRTCRYFDSSKEMPVASLSTLLRLAFGTWATRSLAGEQIQLLLKTSPSGGALHPIEAYPLLFKCEGKRSGLYHYRTDLHALALCREMTEDSARELAIRLAQGQLFVSTCSVVVILVARFDRNFWKYRERENSYAVVLQDAGHLSQTFQICASDLGLGAFYTAAINSELITGELALEYPAQAPIGLLGAGSRLRGPDSAYPIDAFDPEAQRS